MDARSGMQSHRGSDVEPHAGPEAHAILLTEMAMLASAFVYAGFISALLGALSLVKPLAFIGIHSRLQGSFFLGPGLALVAVGWLLPANEARITAPRTRLDEFAPVYQFSEFHSLRINASKERVYSSLKAVTADDILFFRILIWIRRGGSTGPESILNPSPHTPLLDVATRTSFLLLADDANREIVVGTAVVAPPGWHRPVRFTAENYKAIREPGLVLGTMNFLIEETGGGASVISTETRVYATDPSTRRKFALYWRVVYPGSALIRRMWLRAAKQRAEAAE